LKILTCQKIFEQLGSEDDLELIHGGWHTLFIAEDKLKECPKVKVTIGNEEITSILYIGCEFCLMSQDLYNKLRNNGMRNLELPVQNMNLVSLTIELENTSNADLEVRRSKGRSDISHSSTTDNSSLNWCRLFVPPIK
jgi:hypothetical protein